MTLQARYLFTAGDRWETQERAAAIRRDEYIRALPEGVPVGADAPRKREYRTWVKYDGTHESEFLATSDGLMRSRHESFVILPRDTRTERLQTHAFQVLCRGRSRVFAAQDSNKNYPWKFLASGKYGALLDELERDMQCGKRLDSFTAAVMDMMPDSPTSQDSKAIVEHTNALVHDNNASSECRHSQIRRFCMQRGCQNRGIDLLKVNDHEVLKHAQAQARAQRKKNADCSRHA